MYTIFKSVATSLAYRCICVFLKIVQVSRQYKVCVYLCMLCLCVCVGSRALYLNLFVCSFSISVAHSIESCIFSFSTRTNVFVISSTSAAMYLFVCIWCVWGECYEYLEKTTYFAAVPPPVLHSFVRLPLPYPNTGEHTLSKSLIVQRKPNSQTESPYKAKKDIENAFSGYCTGHMYTTYQTTDTHA